MANSSKRHCANCANHGKKVSVKFHKKLCRYRSCQCQKCQLTKLRRSVMAKQIQLRRDQSHQVQVTGNYEVDSDKQLSKPENASYNTLDPPSVLKLPTDRPYPPLGALPDSQMWSGPANCLKSHMWSLADMTAAQLSDMTSAQLSDMTAAQLSELGHVSDNGVSHMTDDEVSRMCGGDGMEDKMGHTVTVETPGSGMRCVKDEMHLMIADDMAAHKTPQRPGRSHGSTDSSGARTPGHMTRQQRWTQAYLGAGDGGLQSSVSCMSANSVVNSSCGLNATSQEMQNGRIMSADYVNSGDIYRGRHTSDQGLLNAGQLQQAFIYLLQHDNTFLETLHEAYVKSVLLRGRSPRH